MTKDNGFALAGYTSSYWTAKSYAWLIKVGGRTTGTTNAHIEKINRTSSVSPTTGLTAVQSSTENLPVEKADGSEFLMEISTLLLVFIIRRKKK